MRLSPRRILVAAGTVALVSTTLAAGPGGGHGSETPSPSPKQAPKPVQMGGAPAAELAPTPKQTTKPQSKPSAPKPAENPAPAPTLNAAEIPTPEQAMAWLREGNERFTANQTTNPNTGTDRVSEVAGEQHPFATILSCADSRVPVERVFDRGVGDLFVVRVAGNVSGESETGTIEYGVGHLHTPLLVVMGHTACGAVNAAASGAVLHGAVAKLVSRIQPSVEQARAQYPELQPAQITPIAVRLNVMNSIENLLTTSEEVRGLVNKGELSIVGAVYDLNSGRVHFLGQHPAQTALISGKAESQTASAKPIPAPAQTEHADAEPRAHEH